jgi:aspartyl-tRNA(Asn)/glutamyl-tRNA(Gln) amidotransferase subunit C
MSISKDDIKKLADLSRIEVTEEEAEKLRGDIESILGYVGQVSSIAGNGSDEGGVNLGPVINVLREDAASPTESGTYTNDIVAEFPHSESNYLKVKKIL